VVTRVCELAVMTMAIREIQHKKNLFPIIIILNEFMLVNASQTKLKLLH
jgi:hypothetical protein